jgi:RNA polymerase sigma-70 factor (ECF subfamily)
MSRSLDDLLALLNTGDRASIEETFRRFEPFLRKVVGRHFPPGLRSKFDPDDVVQSVWRSLLNDFNKADRQFDDVEHLRAFLARAARNRLLDRVRQHCRHLEKEQSLADLDSVDVPAASDPRPSQLLQKQELWEQVLALCPPEHRQLLHLRREGFSLDEIAKRSGLHRDSIRRVFRTLARRLAFATQTAHLAAELAN